MVDDETIEKVLAEKIAASHRARIGVIALMTPEAESLLATIRKQGAAIEAKDAELKRLREGTVMLNTWGFRLFDDMAKFVENASKAGRPLTTKVLCHFRDQPERPVLHLWATTDGQDPIARNGHLRDELTERDAEIVKLRDALECLRDVQNGPPLPSYEADWHDAMLKADVALGREAALAARDGASVPAIPDDSRDAGKRATV